LQKYKGVGMHTVDDVSNFINTEKLIIADTDDWQYEISKKRTRNEYAGAASIAKCLIPVEFNGITSQGTRVEIRAIPQLGSLRTSYEFTLLYADVCITRMKIHPTKDHSNPPDKKIKNELRSISFNAGVHIFYCWEDNKYLGFPPKEKRGVRVAKTINEELNFDDFDNIREYFFKTCYISGYIPKPELEGSFRFL
jgi:hypothetical protein